MTNGNMKSTPKTYGEAMAAGWTMVDSSWCRGYVSRKGDPNNAAIQIAGGSRKGDYFVLLPSWQSTSYCIRQYLDPNGAEKLKNERDRIAKQQSAKNLKR